MFLKFNNNFIDLNYQKLKERECAKRAKNLFKKMEIAN